MVEQEKLDNMMIDMDGTENKCEPKQSPPHGHQIQAHTNVWNCLRGDVFCEVI